MVEIYCATPVRIFTRLLIGTAFLTVSMLAQSRAEPGVDEVKVSAVRTIGRNDARLVSDVVRNPSLGPPNELLLQIKFTIADKWRLMGIFGNSAYFCSRPGIHVYLYRDSLSLAVPASRRIIGSQPGAPISYNLFLSVAWDRSSTDESFDLWRSPEDICFYAGDHGSPSRVLVIPKGAISGALAHLSVSDAQRRCLDYHGGSYLPPPGQLCRFQPPERPEPIDRFEH